MEDKKILNKVIQLTNEDFEPARIAKVLKIDEEKVRYYLKKYHEPMQYQFELADVYNKIDKTKYVPRKSINKKYFKDLKKHYKFSIQSHNINLIQKIYNENHSYRKTAEKLNISYNCVAKTIRKIRKGPFSSIKMLKQIKRIALIEQDKINKVFGQMDHHTHDPLEGSNLYSNILEDFQGPIIKMKLQPPITIKHIDVKLIVDSLGNLKIKE